MKILVHDINFAPELTGVGKYTGEMVEWLAGRGHEVRVVTAPPYYPAWRVSEGYSAWRYKTERWSGARVWRCPLWVPDGPRGYKRVFHLLSFVCSSFPVMLRQAFWRPDAVWTVEPTLLCAPVGRMVARLSGARSWLHVQDQEIDTAYELDLAPRSAGWLRGAVTKWERRLLRRFDRVSTVSRRMSQSLAAKGVAPDRLLELPNWVEIPCTDTSEESARLRAELTIAPGDVVALYSGTMSVKQGMGLLGGVADRLRDTPGLVFVFCGDGPTRDDLVARCEGLANVRFLHLQPRERLCALLAMADIHLLPQEAAAADLVMPSKLTGMLASGRPVVAASAHGTEIAAAVEERGLVSPPGDEEAMADCIRRLVDDPDLRVRLGANARSYAERHLSRDIVLSRFEQDLVRLVTPQGDS